MFKKWIYSLGLLLSLGLVSCIEEDQKAGGNGTASEGENFVYGTVIDQQENGVAQAKVYVALSEVSSEGLESQFSDSTLTDEEGDFEFLVPGEGNYTFNLAGQDSGLTLGSVNLQPKPGGNRLGDFKLGGIMILDIPVVGFENCTSRDTLFAFTPGLSKKFDLKWIDGTGPSDGPGTGPGPGGPKPIPSDLAMFKTLVAAETGTEAPAYYTVDPEDPNFTPHWRVHLPPLYPGDYDVGFLCDEGVQYFKVQIPGGCELYEYEQGLHLLAPDDYPSKRYEPYPYSGQSVLVDEYDFADDTGCDTVTDVIRNDLDGVDKP